MRRSSKALLGIAGAAAVAYLGLSATLYARQRQLLYKFPIASPGGAALTLPLRTRGPRVLVSVRERPGRTALVYYGGNAEDVAANLPAFESAFPRHSLYLLHYRGYGGSEGTPSEANLYADALALLDYASRRHRRVIVVGRSLGSGLAVRVASVRRVARLVLVTPYASIVGIAADQYPWAPVSLILRDRYESFRYAPRVRAPTLMILAEDDQLIPRASSEQLLQCFAPGVARIAVLPGDHSSVTGDPRYLPLFLASPRSADAA
jgi:pimeloyl-ACP methyl ester carboxylesterase